MADRLNNAIKSFPISYEVDGKQYVAVASATVRARRGRLPTLTPEISAPDDGSAL